MAILTKVFVILVTILAILAMALIIPFLDNAFYYKKLALKAQEEKQIADLQAAEAENRVSLVTEEKVEAVKNKDERIEQLTGELREATTQRDELRSKHESTVTELMQVTAAVNTQASTVKKLVEVNAILRNQVSALRAESLDRRLNIVDLQTRLAHMQTESARAELAVRALRAQVADLKVQLADAEKQAELAAQATAKGGVTGASLRTWPQVFGKVRDVEKIGEDTFVEIDLGQNDAVAEDMEFIVHDGPTYVGTLVVTKADKNTSAGRMALLRGEVKPGMGVVSATSR